MSRLALRSRVVVASVGVLAVGVACIGFGLNVLLTNRLSADANQVLRARADAQRATIQRVGGRVVVREGTQDEALDREAWVFTPESVLARPVAPAALQAEAASLRRVASTTIRNAPGEVRLLAEPAFAADGSTRIATVVVGLSLGPYERTERFARLGTVAFALFVLLAGAVIAWRAVGAGLRPVAAMARAAEDYGEHDSSQRFGQGPPRDEITRLAATLDGLLDRLHASLTREKRLSAEIAHELRTPLSGIRAEAELALSGAPGTDPVREALRSVIAGADRMDVAIDALLQAARQSGPSAATCELDHAVQMAIDASAAQARGRGVTLERLGTAAPVVVAAECSFIAQTLQPLLDNAIRHARSAVVIRAGARGVQATVSVEDDGPGIGEQDVARIFEPGVQGQGGSGAGLGLALSRRLALSAGGEVRAEASVRGGRVVAEWPAVSRGGEGELSAVPLGHGEVGDDA